MLNTERKPILAARSLRKTFKDRVAVNDLDLVVREGDVYALLGQNGAGKSTLIRMLLGLIHPDKGEVLLQGEVFNSGNRKLLQHVGAIIERPDLYNYLSGWDNLRMFAALSKKTIPVSRYHEVIELVGLKGREHDKVKTYSLGMKQRLGIAVALIHDPQLLILDEPTNGLDPQGIADIRNLVYKLSTQHSKTIILSSHLLNEVEQVATHMLILHKGNKLKEGAVAELIKKDEHIVTIEIEHNDSAAAAVRQTKYGTAMTTATPHTLAFTMNRDNVPDLVNMLVTGGIGIRSVETSHSLENYFLSLTND